MVCLIRDYYYNYTKSGVESLNIPKTAIYLGLVLLTLVFLKDVAFIWQLAVDNGRMKMGGTWTFHCISTMNIHVSFIKMDRDYLLLSCIPVIENRNRYMWVFVSNFFLNSENLHDNIGKSWNHTTLMMWRDTYIYISFSINFNQSV